MRRRGALLPLAWLAIVPLLAPAACTAPKSDLPVPVSLACNELHEILAAMPFDRVRRAVAPVVPPREALERPGCVITAEGSRERLSVLERTAQHSPHGRLGELLPARGWKEDTRFAGAEPGSARFAYARGGVVCYLAARWSEPGSAALPGALPPDRYEIDARCTGEDGGAG